MRSKKKAATEATVLTTVLTVVLLASARLLAQGSDPLAELAALGNSVAESTPQAGGSIRAKKEGDIARTQRLNDPRNIEAKVDSITTKGFPVVAVKLKVQKPAKEGAGANMKASDVFVVVPKLKTANGAVTMTDVDTTTNAGSFYLQEGDKVVVRIGDKRGAYYEAEYIERK
ncbi:MAG: hypothetical protein H7Z43_09780 [Clostridia bacterium]|nr:hypothetical protein [Deltaproteobacteria bacterium]